MPPRREDSPAEPPPRAAKAEGALGETLPADVHPAATPPAADRAAAIGEWLAIGSVLADRFVIERVIGAGGMGVVYLALDRALERLVAIKLHQEQWGGERLQREAVAMARLAHPHVITVYEVGRIGTRTFVAMEFIAGTTLRRWAAARPRTLRERLRVLAEAGAGLAAAHAAGLVHRDFKPDNILVGDDGRARVGDFGLARGSDSEISRPSAASTVSLRALRTPARGTASPVVAAAAPAARPDDVTQLSSPDDAKAAAQPVDVDGVTFDPTPPPGPMPGSPASPSWRSPPPISGLATPLTQTGAVVGTPAYMAPEQANSGALDARADQFAFCVVAWELLYGARPFAGATLPELVTAIQRAQRTVPPRPKGARVPAAVRQVLERGTSANPDDRFADMSVLLVALHRAEHQQRRRAIAGTSVLAGATLAIAFVLGRGGAADADCAAPARALAALVPDPLPAQLRAVGGDEAGEAAAHVAANLTEARASLARAATQVCTATADHTLSPALAARATACLQIEARTAADLATADGAIAADDVARFVVQTQGMTDASRCADPAMLLAMPAPPVDPAQLAAVEAARAALAAAAATLSGGNVSGATRLLASAEHSPAAADPAIAARITLVRAMLAEESDQLPTAEQGFEDAYYAARAIDDLDVSLAAVAHLVTIADEDDADRAKAERWIKDGVADAERSRARAPHRAATVFVAAAAASSRTHSDRAAAWSASALALLGTAPSLAHVSALGIAGEVACARGDTATCFADHDAAIAEARTLLGPHHIRVAYLLQNAALDYMDAGRANQAVARAREAVELLRATRESSALDRLNSLNTLAALLESSGQAADRANARAILEDVHRQLVAKLGADDPQLVIVESNLATAYTDDQELDRARAMIEHARTVAEANLGKDDPGTADVLFNLADTEEAQAQFAAALPIAKHVVDIRAATAPGTVLHGQALAQVARLENALGDPVSARTHARAALALPALRDPIVARARAQLELARASARSHDAVPAAEGVAALADARAIFVAFELPDGVAACDRVTLRP